MAVNQIKESQRKVIGVEMEAYSLYAAAIESSAPAPTPIAFKAVVDFANPTKADTIHKYAAYVSAEVTKVFITDYLYK